MSRHEGKAGDEIWLLLSSTSDSFDEALFDARLTCYIGDAKVDSFRAIAPNVFASNVPADAPLGATRVRLLARPSGGADEQDEDDDEDVEVECKCSMDFEVVS